MEDPHPRPGATLIGAAAQPCRTRRSPSCLDQLFRAEGGRSKGPSSSCSARSSGARPTATTGRRRPSPGPSSASGSRRRRHGPTHTSARYGVGPPAPRRVALCGGPVLRQGARRGRRGHARDRASALRDAGQGVHRAPAGRPRPLDGAVPSSRPVRSEHERRFVRFNDAVPHHDASSCRRESYAETRTALEARARDGPLRRRDALGPAPLRRLRRADPLVAAGRPGTGPPRRARTSSSSTSPWPPSSTRLRRGDASWPASSSATA